MRSIAPWVCLLACLATPASAETVNPFGGPAVQAQPVTVTPVPTYQPSAPLPPLSYFALIGRVALLSDGQRVIRAAHGRPVTILGAKYQVELEGDELVLFDDDDKAVFYASLGYGVRTEGTDEQ